MPADERSSLTRRRLLGACATTAVAALAGCSLDEEDPTDTGTPTASGVTPSQSSTPEAATAAEPTVTVPSQVREALPELRATLATGLERLVDSGVVVHRGGEFTIALERPEPFAGFADGSKEHYIEPARTARERIDRVTNFTRDEYQTPLVVLNGIAKYEIQLYGEYRNLVVGLRRFRRGIEAIEAGDLKRSIPLLKGAVPRLTQARGHRQTLSQYVNTLGEFDVRPRVRGWDRPTEADRQRYLRRMFARQTPGVKGVRDHVLATVKASDAARATRRGDYQPALILARDARNQFERGDNYLRVALRREPTYHPRVFEQYQCQATSLREDTVFLVKSVEAYRAGDDDEGDELFRIYRERVQSGACDGTSTSTPVPDG